MYWKRWNEWKTWGHKAFKGMLPTLSKVNAVDGVIFDFARQLLGSSEPTERLGSNLITNGDFHDFTMENDANTVGHWVFSSGYNDAEGGSGNIGEDWSGNSHTLSPNGDIENTTETESLPQYQGVSTPELDGVNDYWYIPAAQAGDFNAGAGNFTVEAWINTSGTTNGVIVDKGGRLLVGGFFIRHLGTGDLQVTIYDGTNTVCGRPTGNAINDGLEHHIAVVYTAATSIEMYIDGSSKTVDLTGDDISSLGSLSSSTDLSIGCANNGSTDIFVGNIYEVRYSDTARSAQEIKESYGLAKGWESSDSPAVSNVVFSQSVSRYPENGSNPSVYTTTSLDSDELYKFEFDVKKTGAGDNYFRAFVYNSSPLCGVSSSTLIPSTDYTHYSFYFKGISGSTAIYLRHYTNTDGYSAIFDNIEVKKVINASWTDGIFVEDFSLGGRKYGNELLYNYDFDGSTEGWLGSNGGILSIDVNDNLECVCGASNGGITISLDYRLTYSGILSYKVEFKIRRINTSGDTRFNVVQYYDGSYNSISQFTGATMPTEWTVYTIYIKPNAISGDGTFTIRGYSTVEFELEYISIKEVNNGNHGIMYGSLEESGTMVHPAAIEFDGVNDYIDAPTTVNLNQFFIFGWIKPGGFTGSYRGFVQYGDTRPFRIILDDTGNYIIFQIILNNGQQSGVLAYNPNEWNFYSFYYDGDNVYYKVNDLVTNDIDNSGIISSDDEFRVGLAQWRFDGFLGITGLYKFNSFPSNIDDIINLIYNNTCELYGKEKI